MRSTDLIIGDKYQIKYRKFLPDGRVSYSGPLQNGIGMLVSMYDAGNYNHSFVLDSTGERVWATPNSVICHIDKSFGSNSSIVSDIVGPDSEISKSLLNVSSFLRGIGVHNKIVEDNIVIQGQSVSALNKLLHKLYSDILDF